MTRQTQQRSNLAQGTLESVVDPVADRHSVVNDGLLIDEAIAPCRLQSLKGSLFAQVVGVPILVQDWSERMIVM
jgi:hypothetical protein